MEKVEQFIKEHTRNCSNEIAHWDIGGENVKPIYSLWLTPDDARKVAEIARQETIKEVCKWVENNVYSYTWCDFLQHERGIETGKLIEDLKKHLNGKL